MMVDTHFDASAPMHGGLSRRQSMGSNTVTPKNALHVQCALSRRPSFGSTSDLLGASSTNASFDADTARKAFMASHDDLSEYGLSCSASPFASRYGSPLGSPRSGSPNRDMFDANFDAPTPKHATSRKQSLSGNFATCANVSFDANTAKLHGLCPSSFETAPATPTATLIQRKHALKARVRAMPRCVSQANPKVELALDSTTSVASNTAAEQVSVAVEEPALVGWWHTHGHRFYPKFLTSGAESIVSFIFWHSMLLTLITPLGRLVSGAWNGTTLLVPLAANAAAAATTGRNPRYSTGIPYPRIAKGSLEDTTLILHASFGLLWIAAGYIQMVHFSSTSSSASAASNDSAKQKKTNWNLHRWFGTLSLLALVGHLSVCLFTLYVDPVQHRPLNKMMLATAAIDAIVLAYQSMAAIARKRPNWRLSHQDAMVACYVVSTSGAGNIRQIGHIQSFLNVGPVACQNRNGSLVAGDCMWPYAIRMMLIVGWNCYVVGGYCVARKNTNLTLAFIKNAKTILVAISIISALSYVPYSVEALDLLLGAERTMHGNISCCVMLLLRCLL